jgi:hypothetical protein
VLANGICRPAIDMGTFWQGSANIGSQQLQRLALQQILARYSKDTSAMVESARAIRAVRLGYNTSAAAAILERREIEHTDQISPRCRRPVLKGLWWE